MLLFTNSVANEETDKQEEMKGKKGNIKVFEPITIR
jgi:hypothetical protein